MVLSKLPTKKTKRGSPRKASVSSVPLLVEIGTEEIPTTFFPQALQDLKALGQQLLHESRLGYEKLRTVGTSRRLALLVEGVETKQPSLMQEIVGPPKSAAFDATGEPTKAAQGFAKSQGVSVKQLVIKDMSKGAYLVVKKHERGQSAKRVLMESLPAMLAKLTFPKAMRWNASQAKFARPIRWTVVILGDQVLKINFAGIRSGGETYGHRFYRKKAKKAVALTNARAYIATMKKCGVMVDPSERRAAVISQVAALAKSAKGRLDPIYREELIEEAVWGVEYPYAICGTFQKEFLDLPKPVLISSMKEHQGFFSLVGKSEALLPKFIAVTNTPWGDRTLMKKGNERVLSARLSDAQHFFNEDRKQPLFQRLSALDGVTFHHKLGTMRQKVDRIRDIASGMAAMLDRPDIKEVCERSSLLSKADLTTGMVGEFPNLQGVMGEEYAHYDGEGLEICKAIREHYLPRFPEDNLPESLSGQVVACADRCDSIASFFAVGMAPSGSEDPLGLRRAAYGLVRIMNETPLRLNLVEVFEHVIQILMKQGVCQSESKTATDIMGFILDRLRYYGRTTMGLRDDVMEAVTRVRPKDTVDVKDLLSRMQALQDIVGQADFETLMIGFKRAHRIVEKEAWRHSDVLPERFQHDSEQRLFQVLEKAQQEVANCVAKQEYAGALQMLLGFKWPIDEFFATVLVNDPDSAIRENRLSLLTAIDWLFLTIADFSRIQSVGAESG